MVQRILSSIFPLSMTGYFFCFFSFLTHVLTQNGKKYTETAEPSSPESSRFCMQCCPKWPEMVNCAILKQLITRRSQVRVLSPQPESPDFLRDQDFFRTFAPNNLLAVFSDPNADPNGICEFSSRQHTIVPRRTYHSSKSSNSVSVRTGFSRISRPFRRYSGRGIFSTM